MLTNTPIEKAEIRTLVPHSGSMCLLDRVAEWDERSILCVSDTHRDAANPLRRKGQLSAVHAVEYGAQAAAVHGALRARAAGVTTPSGYLAALHDTCLHVTRLDDVRSPLQVFARQLFGDAANSVYQCSILAGSVPVADARITIVERG